MGFTIGSLFDGSGGFPLAAFMCGGEPVWASEIEPYPIAVTKSRFPYVKHLGSVTDIRGNEIDPVDVVTFGSPCQDLSVAGKRAGLKHEDNGDEETTRSGLFLDAVRIIKEMREATNGVYPRIALWENVPGAFSSNKGEDFRVVLEELIKIVEPTAVMPEVPKAGWAYADYYSGDGWSLAYRILDAQYWGVPQRRRRIYLVLDLGGQRAGEILFKRDGLRGYFEEGKSPWQGVAGDVENRVGAADCEKRVAYGISPYHSNSMLSSNPHSGIYVADTARTLDAMNCGYPGCNQGGIAVVEPKVYRKGTRPHSIDEAQKWEEADVTNTINTFDVGETRANELIVEQHLFENHSQDSRYRGPLEVSPMLPAQLGTGGNNQPLVVSTYWDGTQIAGTLTANNANGAQRMPDKENFNCVVAAYTMQAFGDYSDCGVASSLKQRDYKDATDLVVFDKEVYQSGANASGGHYISEGGPAPTLRTTGHPPGVACGVDCRNLTESPELYPTLQAKPNGGQSLNYSGAVRVQYIVRRLTPTECARLQGFPDKWGHPDRKDDFTDDEYAFWLNVRNTHAEINGKATKEYTKAQMLTWYNKLHTDSSEYKMWGNGIALPCALYVMQGISEVLG